jgi:hypothetical protein
MTIHALETALHVQFLCEIEFAFRKNNIVENSGSYDCLCFELPMCHRTHCFICYHWKDIQYEVFVRTQREPARSEERIKKDTGYTLYLILH